MISGCEPAKNGIRHVDDLLGAFRWWALRPAQSLKPTSYTCPLCDEQLHATSEHMLMVPEGDLSRRRHAHSDCVAKASRAGRLPSLEQWRKRAQPGPGLRKR